VEIERKTVESPFPGHSRSEIHLSAGFVKCTLSLRGPISKRMRRTMLVSVFRALVPVFRELSGYITHAESAPLNRFREEERGISLKQSPEATTSPQRLGFQIRIRRLKLKLTQAELAGLCEIRPSHLCELERGRCNPRPGTLRVIVSTLQRLEEGSECQIV
jgi:DNA-binding XRE family transcriptional regulator